MNSIKIGTRQSRLAMWQTDHIIDLLQQSWPGLLCEKITFVTEGDKTLDKPLPQIGGKGLFTLELEQALHQGEIDLAVHSLKDLPVEEPAGIILGAIVGRADVRDVLIARNGWTLQTLPHGAKVGTSSLRRKAQLLVRRPDLNIQSIRGNVETRIHKALHTEEYDAVVLAAAGVTRLGLTEHITQWLPLETMLPAPGQGALAVQCRAGDERSRTLLAGINNLEVRACVRAERVFLHELAGGCATPVAAYATMEKGSEQDRFHLTGLVAAPDGSFQVGVTGAGRDPDELGRKMAENALARGAKLILHPLLQPLKDKRILVTRSAEQAADFAALLRERGARPVLFPVIAFQALPSAPLEKALAKIHDYEWLIFTSVNGVEFFFAAHNGQPLPRVAVVGSATRSKLEAFDVSVDFMPDQFTGQQLALGLGDLKDRRVLLPRAKKGRPVIVAQLREQGALVDDIPLYDTVTATPTAEAWAELKQGFAVVTFTSPSSVRNFIKIVGEEWLPYLQNSARVACIGPSTAAEARNCNLPVAIVPPEYTLDGLLEAIEQAYA